MTGDSSSIAEVAPPARGVPSADADRMAPGCVSSAPQILMLPDYRRDNPYQTLLARALERQGYRVCFPAGYRRILPLFRAVRSDRATRVLHLHWTSPYLKGRSRIGYFLYVVKFLIDVLLVRLAGVRVVWTLHNLVPHETRFPRLDLWCRRILCRLSDAVIVHGTSGEVQARTVLKCPANRIAIIPHGHYRDVYARPIACHKARQSLGLPAGARVFLFFGMIRPYKGLEQLLRVWRTLGFHDACLVIAGRCLDPQFGREIADLARNTFQVRLVPQFIPDAEIPKYFSAADVVVLPFVQVQTSGSLLLAMSYGKPTIAPRLGDIPEALRGADDLLFEAANETSLKCRLEEARQQDLEDLSRRTRAACDRLDWTRIGRATGDVYFPLNGTPSEGSHSCEGRRAEI